MLELGYAPERLLFVARGEAPFVLAYGHPEVPAGTFTAEDLLASLPPGTPLEALLPAKLGTISRPEAPPPPAPQPIAWQRIALWATLVVGVATLGWMATRLVRAISRSTLPTQPPTDTER